MEELLKSPAFQQVPGLVIMAFVVVTFIKYIKARDEFISEMHKDHLQARELSRLAMEGNADATRRNTLALNEMSEVVARMKHRN